MWAGGTYSSFVDNLGALSVLYLFPFLIVRLVLEQVVPLETHEALARSKEEVVFSSAAEAAASSSKQKLPGSVEHLSCSMLFSSLSVVATVDLFMLGEANSCRGGQTTNGRIVVR